MVAGGLAPGRYFIVNDVQSDIGFDLAVQYHGPGVPVTVETKRVTPPQVWIVTGQAGFPQHVSPETDEDLQNGPVEDLIAPGNTHYAWNISLVQGLYMIQDADKARYWNINEPAAKQTVVLTSDPGQPTVYWKFLTAPARV